MVGKTMREFILISKCSERKRYHCGSLKFDNVLTEMGVRDQYQERSPCRESRIDNQVH